MHSPLPHKVYLLPKYLAQCAAAYLLTIELKYTECDWKTRKFTIH